MNETFKVGDRVRIHGTSWGGRACYGRTGTVDSRSSYYDYPYNVVVDGPTGTAMFRASALTKIEEPTPTPEPVPPIELPMANLQAATFAHQLLGPSADLDKLIGVAEFAMDRRTVPGVLTELVAEAAAPAVEASSEDLVITDRDGDKFTVSHYGAHGTLAKVYVRNAGRGDQFAAYLTEADVDAVIARLQAFKAEGFTAPF